MKILFLLLTYYILESRANFSLSAPVNAILMSSNFQHILHWGPGRDSPPQTVYRVKWCRNNVCAKWSEELPHTGHTFDVSKYMKDIYKTYTLQMWASLGSRSSSVVNVTPIDFEPFKMTTIGPPSVDVLGCGDCLNISMLLTKGEGIQPSDSRFYNAIGFIIYWKRANDEKDVVMQQLYSSNHQHHTTHVTSVYTLQNLQPQEEYCVQVQPQSNVNSNVLRSEWLCAFTSTVQPRKAVSFLVIWTIGSILVGLCFLLIIAILAYTGNLCKLKVARPKVLTVLVPDFLFHTSMEDVWFSVVESDSCIRTNKLKYLLQPVEGRHTQENREEGGSKEEDEDDSMDSHCVYMDRAANSRESCTTNNVQSFASTAICESAKNSGECSFEDVPVQAEETTLSELQLHVVRDDKGMSSPETVEQKPKPLKSKELEREEIKDKTERGGLNNINLLSLTLKSMQLEEQEVSDTGICEPLLPILLRDQQEDALPFLSKPQLRVFQTPVLYQENLKVDRLMGQKELKDFSEMRSDYLDQSGEKVSMDTTCLQTRNYGSSNEDKEYYMGR